MIHVTLHEEELLTQFIDARATYSGKDRTGVAEEIMREGFYALVKSLHEQFMRGEISQGRMAELLGIGRLDLIHLLENMDLQVTNL
ncbi:MAG: hypothetical protein BroJett018_44130 [Chloroflexota bacterium]|nr:hypothetical protein [Chloroflexota bacterium]NOG65231.1 hypothetical protein [Chloroflexota bacterium]GIK66619.1 MAG: hypothetical protein BroJett018_44130 [Chloroflexota bacterium]